MSLVVVGTLGFDCVKTPFGERENVLGGSASFLGMSASYFTNVHMVGVIGNDFPDHHLELFHGRGINTEAVQKLDGQTFRWRGAYDYNLSEAQTLETQLNVLSEFQPDLPSALRDAKYAVLGNFAPDLQLAVLEQLRDPTLVTADTMNFWIEGALPELKKTLKRVDILSINEGEARELSGEYNLVHAARAIHGLGPKVVVIKRGEYGAMLFKEHEIFAIPAYPLQVVRDPTGAGDSFAGGMMGYLCRRNRPGDPMVFRQGLVHGTTLASFAVEDFSVDRFRSLQWDDIRARFAEIKKLTHFEAED